MVNFLALLGWNPGDDTEIMSMDELIAKFSFDHCSRSGAKFDFEKGKWFNHRYLQEMGDDALAQLYKPVLAAHGVDPSAWSDGYIARVVGLVKSRINFVGDLWEQSRFFFVEPAEYEEKSVRKRWNADMPAIMAELVEVLKGADSFDAKVLEPVVLGWIADKGYHLGNVMNAFRLTVVGECKGPHMFDITELLGRDETIRRIRLGIERLG